MKIKVYLLNAFGVNKSGGNPAGVVLDADDLTDEAKKKIAKEIGFSETAFVQKSSKADFKVTFFTPTDEVDLCGHATIATYSLLLQKKIIKPGKYTHELKAGVLPIEITTEGVVFMDLALPVFSETISFEELKEIFLIQKNTILDTGLQPQIVSTGLRDIILPIKDRQTLYNLEINFQKMAALNKKTDTIGFHLFTLDTIKSNSTANVRNFFPLHGVNEEPATGSANGTLACYLFKYGRIKTENTKNLIFEQGYCMNKPSEIIASLNVEREEIKRIQIGGHALFNDEMEIEITN